MTKKIVLIGIFILAAVIAVNVIAFIAIPPYEHGQWSIPYNQKEHQFSFCSYKLPSGFEFFGYSHDVFYQKEMLMFKNSVADSYILLFRLREFPDVDVDNIKITDKKITKSLRHGTTQFRNGMNFTYLLPTIFINKNVDSDNRILSIGGMKLLDTISMTQDVVDITSFKGEFEKIAFIKKSKDLYKYPTPVLDFQKKENGYLSIVKSNKLSESFFVLYYGNSFDNLTEQDFMAFLKSITFEKNTLYLKKLYEDAYKSGSLVDIKTKKPLKK